MGQGTILANVLCVYDGLCDQHVMQLQHKGQLLTTQIKVPTLKTRGHALQATLISGEGLPLSD